MSAVIAIICVMLGTVIVYETDRGWPNLVGCVLLFAGVAIALWSFLK